MSLAQINIHRQVWGIVLKRRDNAPIVKLYVVQLYVELLNNTAQGAIESMLNAFKRSY